MLDVFLFENWNQNLLVIVGLRIGASHHSSKGATAGRSIMRYGCIRLHSLFFPTSKSGHY